MVQEYLTVTALTKYLKRKFEADPYLGRIYLTGEISNFRMRANAHQYFSLKDSKAKISAIMFKSAFQQLKFEPKEGMKVLVIGRISLYEASGQYQIYIEHMEPDGVGALYQALEEMKEKLKKEGLFQAPKKMLPAFPKKIAVITSPSGAVIRDIMTTAKRRYPIAQLVLFPTLVQGNQAAADIVKNIERVEQLGDFDTMIIARGGGSIEDLWPFNEEKVARAIFGARTPVISSVGHETDTTIADLVADIRAATPTAAAELAVPVLSEELLKIKEKENRLVRSFGMLIRQNKLRYASQMDSYIFKQPQRLYEGFSMKLDLLNRQFETTSKQLLQVKQKQYQAIQHAFELVAPYNRVQEQKQQLRYLNQALKQQMKQALKEKQQQFNYNVQSLDVLSPLRTMGRGYSYVTKEEKVIHSVRDLKEKETLTIHMKDGLIEANVTAKKIDNKEEKE
ncbi:exodeoxyribonuclease VII large subunit [Vagococcus entomophilus]|uniref:Exodeoxyribonuclease 7 large subunit n=1 Tax=Vagococcus entomophilus TaxID=1160095 RepID=A0A430AIA1_9ENTE|nr:exodeoxyribonuclease VII large subunit [Vagococcus entomophilus]RSU07815.1 exodeoxyribonuclease VII large subunit [Vagococcus entomophilus]